MGTYKVRNEIEKKRNETKSTKTDIYYIPPPAIQRKRGYIVDVRLSMSASLTPYAIPPNNFMELNECYRKSLIPYGKVH